MNHKKHEYSSHLFLWTLHLRCSSYLSLSHHPHAFDECIKILVLTFWIWHLCSTLVNRCVRSPFWLFYRLFGRSKGIRPFILTCSFCLKTHTKRQGLPAPCRRQKNRPEGRICTKRGKNIETHYLHEALASKRGVL